MVVKEAPAREAPKEAIRLQQVPISAIFNAEFNTLGTSPERQEDVRKAYELYATGLMNAVSVWLGFGEAVKADRQKLAKAVNKVDERELFSFLLEVFRKDFNASFKKDMPLATSIEYNKFNCYSSSVLLADVLTRLGKPVSAIILEKHILLAGEEYILETTGNAKTGVYPRAELGSRHSIRQEADVAAALLSITYDWRGFTLSKASRDEEALEAYDRALELNPKDAIAWNNKGVTLSNMGRLDEALSPYDKVLELNPKDAEAWNNKGVALHGLATEAPFFERIKLKREARACLRKAVELEKRKE